MKLITLFQSILHICFHLMTVHYSIWYDWLAFHQERLKTSLDLLDTGLHFIAKTVHTYTNMIHGCWNVIYTDLSFTLTQQHHSCSRNCHHMNVKEWRFSKTAAQASNSWSKSKVEGKIWQKRIKNSSNQKCKPWILGQSKIIVFVISKHCVLIQTSNSQHKLN